MLPKAVDEESAAFYLYIYFFGDVALLRMTLSFGIGPSHYVTQYSVVCVLHTESRF